MAWRIHDSVFRGEIDNRQHGLGRGQLWPEGLFARVVLDLKGED
jgi:hypothetical protein